jgi:hypothetical protein
MATVANPIVNPNALFGPVPVPRLWPESTIVCIGSGPSLTREDVEYCHGKAHVIAIKNVIELAPWADVLYGAGKDAGGMTWWRREGPKLKFQGLRYTLDPAASQWASVLNIVGHDGLSNDPSGLCPGGNSGYQAINLAVHLGAKRIVLLGYDMKASENGRDHYFGYHPHRQQLPYRLFLKRFHAIEKPLKVLGITVLNASRSTALGVFPRCSLKEALSS